MTRHERYMDAVVETDEAYRRVLERGTLGRGTDVSGVAAGIENFIDKHYSVADMEAWLRRSREYQDKQDQPEDSPAPTPTPTLPRGLVRGVGSGIADVDGEFLGLGLTFFGAPHVFRYDKPRLDSQLQYIRDAGEGQFNYLRILTTAGGNINRNWDPIHLNPADPGWKNQIADTIDHVYENYGMRCQVDIHGGALEGRTRREIIDDVSIIIANRKERVIAVMLGNELWQTTPGYWEDNVAEIRADYRYMQQLLPDHLSGPTSSSGDYCPDWSKLYEGLGASKFSEHYDRDQTGDSGLWRPVRQPFDAEFCDALPAVKDNEEGIGPGSSGISEDDPLRLVSAMVSSYVCGHAMHVLHSTSGVQNRTLFQDLPNSMAIFRAFAKTKPLLPPDLPRWNTYSSNGRYPHCPFYALDHSQLARGYGAVRGNNFVHLPFGIHGNSVHTAKQDLEFELYDMETGGRIHGQPLDAGQSFVIEGSSYAALLMVGQWR